MKNREEVKNFISSLFYRSMQKTENINQLIASFLKTNDQLDLKSLAFKISETIKGIAEYSNEYDKGLATKEIITEGSAITTDQAIDCINDSLRTKHFLQATINAIEEALSKRESQKPIKVLYTGCGPFAPFFILSLIHKGYNPSEVQFDLCEINPYSLKVLRKLISALALTNHVKLIEEVDCAKYKIKKAYDIFFNETMDAGLENESMFYVMKNIVPQLSPKTKIIPKNVKLFVSTWKNKGLEAEYLSQTPLMDLMKTIKSDGAQSKYPSKQIRLPEIGSISIDTQVEIDGELTLKENESFITRQVHVICTKREYHFSFDEKKRKWAYH